MSNMILYGSTIIIVNNAITFAVGSYFKRQLTECGIKSWAQVRLRSDLESKTVSTVCLVPWQNSFLGCMVNSYLSIFLVLSGTC